MHWRVETGIRNFLERVGQDLDVLEAWMIGGRANAAAIEVEVAIVIDGHGHDGIEKHSAMAHMETGVMVVPFIVARHEWETPSLHASPALILAIKAEGTQIAGIGSGAAEISSNSEGIICQRASASSPFESFA